MGTDELDPVTQVLVSEEWRLSPPFEYAKKFPWLIDEETACKFWALTEQTEDCWYWTDALDGKGYGLFRPIPGGRQYRAAHIAMIDVGREQPSENHEIDHLCFNRSCVNPAHLEWVTHAINMRRATLRRRDNERILRSRNK